MQRKTFTYIIKVDATIHNDEFLDTVEFPKFNTNEVHTKKDFLDFLQQYRHELGYERVTDFTDMLNEHKSLELVKWYYGTIMLDEEM